MKTRPRNGERSRRTVRNENAFDLSASIGAHIDMLQSLVTPGAARLGVARTCDIIDSNLLCQLYKRQLGKITRGGTIGRTVRWPTHPQRTFWTVQEDLEHVPHVARVRDVFI